MKIILGTFKDEADDLSAFLEPRLGAKPEVASGELTFDDESVKKTIRSRHVKTYIKRYLNRKGERQKYKILVEDGELRLIELEGVGGKEEEEEEEAGKKKEAESKSKEREDGSEEAKKTTASQEENDEGAAEPPAKEEESPTANEEKKKT